MGAFGNAQRAVPVARGETAGDAPTDALSLNRN